MLEFKKQGMTMIIITHKLNEVVYVADKITVVRDGSTIEDLDCKTQEIDEARIIKGMVGREITDRFPKRHDITLGDINLEVQNWSVDHPVYEGRKVVDNVNFNVRKGEVVGIYGLMGAGRTELSMSIFGQSYGSNIQGKLLLDGKETVLKSPREAINAGVAYVTESRKENGLVLSNTIKVNTSLANMKDVSNNSVIDADKEYAVAVEYKDKLRTRLLRLSRM